MNSVIVNNEDVLNRVLKCADRLLVGAIIAFDIGSTNDFQRVVGGLFWLFDSSFKGVTC